MRVQVRAQSDFGGSDLQACYINEGEEYGHEMTRQHAEFQREYEQRVDMKNENEKVKSDIVQLYQPANIVWRLKQVWWIYMPALSLTPWLRKYKTQGIHYVSFAENLHQDGVYSTVHEIGGGFER